MPSVETPHEAPEENKGTASPEVPETTPEAASAERRERTEQLQDSLHRVGRQVSQLALELGPTTAVASLVAEECRLTASISELREPDMSEQHREKRGEDRESLLETADLLEKLSGGELEGDDRERAENKLADRVEFARTMKEVEDQAAKDAEVKKAAKAPEQPASDSADEGPEAESAENDTAAETSPEAKAEHTKERLKDLAGELMVAQAKLENAQEAIRLSVAAEISDKGLAVWLAHESDLNGQMEGLWALQALLKEQPYDKAKSDRLIEGFRKKQAALKKFVEGEELTDEVREGIRLNLEATRADYAGKAAPERRSIPEIPDEPGTSTPESTAPPRDDEPAKRPKASRSPKLEAMDKASSRRAEKRAEWIFNRAVKLEAGEEIERRMKREGRRFSRAERREIENEIRNLPLDKDKTEYIDEASLQEDKRFRNQYNEFINANWREYRQTTQEKRDKWANKRGKLLKPVVKLATLALDTFAYNAGLRTARGLRRAGRWIGARLSRK